jgi:hypothetical protein
MPVAEMASGTLMGKGFNVNDVDRTAWDWRVRAFVYEWVVASGHLPSVAESAAGLGADRDDVVAAYRRLHDRHALFLEPGSDGAVIRMAHPFSGVQTACVVHAGGRAFWANCAWDAPGIPAALHRDARIEATVATGGERVTIAIAGDRVVGAGELVHFPLPFSRWYDDLIET